MEEIYTILWLLMFANWWYIFYIYFKNKQSVVELIFWITWVITLVLFIIGSISLIGESAV